MTATMTLANALAGLLEQARAAGVSQDVARTEGEALAATVADGADGAASAWSAQTGGDRSLEEFQRAAKTGQPWRSTPTPSLARLAATGDPQAAAYARALTLVATAAAGLGTPTTATVGKATSAAAAQMGAFAVTDVPTLTTGSAQATRQGGDPLTDRVATLWQDVMGALNGLRAQDPGPVRGDRGSSLDLGRDADNWAPGAFDLSGDSRRIPTRTGPPAGSPEGDGRSAATDLPANPAAEPSPSASAATTGDPLATTPEEEQPSLQELLDQLDALVGLTEVKATVHRQVALLRIEAERSRSGLKTPNLTRHLVFVGNPGTGKTTVARLVGGIYRALGLLSKGQLIEVDRSGLVAGYLGQTAMKTAEVVASAVGGVLFIDEAYALAGDQYGGEAVDTLVKEMEDHREDLVIIVAGYPVPMALFIAENPGLESRFRTTIDFLDYTDDELVAIFRMIAGGADYDVDDAVEARFRQLLAEAPRGPSFGNGRFARNAFEAAVEHHAWRLRDVTEPTVPQLRTLLPEDLTGPVEPALAAVEHQPDATEEVNS
ncbi:MAG: AAA family ATPase [Nostocoides sp.]